MAVGGNVFTWNIRGARRRAKRSRLPNTTWLLWFSPKTSPLPHRPPTTASYRRKPRVIYLEWENSKKENGRPVAQSRQGTQIGLEKTVLKRKAHIKLKGTQGSERLSPPPPLLPPQWRRMAVKPGTGAAVDKSLPTCRFTMLGWKDKCVKRGVCQSPWRGGPHTDAGQ